MRRRTVLLGAVLAASLACLSSAGSAREASGEAVQERIRARLESGEAGPRSGVAGERLHSAPVLAAFYEARSYRPAWSTGGRLDATARALVESLRAADAEGLTPSDYHIEVLDRFIARVGARSDGRSVAEMADLDLLLTDAYLLFAAHLLLGHVDPVSFDPEWIVPTREADIAGALERALASGRIRESLAGLLPRDAGYAALRDALAAYRAIARAGGWPEIGAGPALKPGETGPRVAALRSRLGATGDLAGDPSPEAGGGGAGAPGTFDEALERAVRRFQARHGLDADGVVGAKTLEALNVSAASRARQVAINLERWRWLPQDLGARHVLVNTPEFRLRLVEEGREALSMAVIVGRSYRRTPVFSDLIRYMVFNPYWEIPSKLAVQDKLPEIRKDPAYLAKEKIRVLRGWGADEREVDPATVDWHRLGARHFPFRLRQDPGERNALGRIKFMFPNRFNVYLHDTPGRELFSRTDRDMSSGCIRVEKPLELAEALLARTPDWDRASIEQAIATGRTRTVTLPEPVPVHLLYWTAWVDDDGSVNFRRDLYGRDRLLDAAMGQPPPEPGTDRNSGEEGSS